MADSDPAARPSPTDPESSDQPDTPTAATQAAELDVPALVDRVDELLLDGPRRYTRDAIAKESGVDVDEARRLWRALGFASVADDDEVFFTDADLTALRRVRELTEIAPLDDAVLRAMTRILGQTFSRLASWQGQMVVELVAKSPELVESADRVVDVVGRLVDTMQELQSYVWRRQLVAYFTRIASGAAEGTLGAEETMVVGFADMAEFTALTRRASEAELRAVLEAFESTANEVVGAHRGRIVKTIGDEVLFVADTPADGAGIALDLLDAAESDDVLPPLRIGVAAGQVISRLGDVFGQPVNIASRLTSLSRTGAVLVDQQMAKALEGDDRYELHPLRPTSVRGYHHLRSWRLRRSDASRGGS